MYGLGDYKYSNLIQSSFIMLSSTLYIICVYYYKNIDYLINLTLICELFFLFAIKRKLSGLLKESIVVDNVSKDIFDLKKFLLTNGAMWVSGIAAFIVVYGNRLIVYDHLSLEEFGIFSAVLSIAIQLAAFLNSSLQPLLNKFHNNKESRYYLKRSTGILMLIASLAILSTYFFGDIFGELIFREKWRSDYILPMTIIISTFFITSCNSPGYYFLMAKKMYFLIASINSILAILSACLIYFLSKSFGLLGASIGISVYCISITFFFISLKVLSKMQKESNHVG
ncbi:lipopolysaccharide biosynthesis protein [Deinococcus aquaticus]|uniref:lipopolysaccharide biosynthesis protein n=1 Tax=Deinococcus aquaticus TaxID=328692 RepID=UPI003F467D6C